MTGHMPASAPERVATLDLLRFAAALSVVGFHYFFRGSAGDPYLRVAYPEAAHVAIFGYLGVSLFFLISGFVIAWSAEGSTAPDFAVARILRIYPGFVVCMSASFAAQAWFADPRLAVTSSQFWANLVILAPWQPYVDGAYWSIVLELVFYYWVTVALALGVFSRWKLELIAFWLWTVGMNEFVLGSSLLRFVFVTEYGAFFAAGVLVHHISTKGRSPESLLLLACAFLLSCNTMRVNQAWMLDNLGRCLSFGTLILANLVLHAALIAAVRWRGFVRPTPLLLALGGLTYPLYLLHQNIGYEAINALAPVIGRWPAALLTVVCMIAAAWMVWRFVETPIRRLLQGRWRRMSQQPAELFAQAATSTA